MRSRQVYDGAMTISVPNELDPLLQRQADAQGLTVEQYVGQLILDDSAWTEAPPLTERDAEFDDVRAAVAEGMAQAERGEGRPVGEVLAELRSKLGLHS